VTVLFGSLFSVSSGDWLAALALGGAALSLVAMAWRPLLLGSVSPELAAARGAHLRWLESAYLASVALSVALAAMTVGAILSTALLIGPAAAAIRLAKSPGRACAWAAGIGLVAVWAGIVLAYDSYDWPPAQRGWPVSFFVVFLVLAIYVAAQLFGRAGSRRRTRPGQTSGHRYELSSRDELSRFVGRASPATTVDAAGAAGARGRRHLPGRS
jgi:zinc/manganese transport system permease protein